MLIDRVLRLGTMGVMGMLFILAGPVRAADKPKDDLALPREGFACCNLHVEKDWISDGNYALLPMIAAGTPVKLLSLGRHKAHALIDGRKMRFGHDYGRDQESLEQWLAKIVTSEDPRTRLAGFPADVQAAIKAGKVMVGMTREQAIMSIGYPLTSETPSLDSPVWRHWVSSFEEYQLIWGKDGRISEISGDPRVRAQIVYQP